ncbi:hypothetical protein N7468_006377 [Penicillium chermesinum]|uniref:ER membrane protein complex subunit 10 n=1 Tax=Penicillium chermesinum TaxID=63820 RepID=A0A9W9TJI4_9EURO|nr:uncharacterized protein N7468_006377 [Penicillium chermesinum]KAJ5225152.1 hypothetical protein N7468_006377 [Penicillium chermesinum]KAJ6140466.1 hypothetical protein N7470_010262 [Penicillium chermesinum]
MHLRSLLGALALPIVALADITTDIFYWPVHDAQPTVLARVSYDPATLKSDLLSYHPPSTTDSDDLLRIGLYTSTSENPKLWSGSLVSRSALSSDAHQPQLRLHLGPTHEVFHVSLGATPATSSASPEHTDLKVQLISSAPGPQPHLNRPVVIGPDGQNPEEVPEKTLLQKYWWVLLIVMFLTMSGGGEGQ